MIIDHDKTKATGKLSLMKSGDDAVKREGEAEVEKTMPLRIADVVNGLKAAGKVDPRSTVTGRISKLGLRHVRPAGITVSLIHPNRPTVFDKIAEQTRRANVALGALREPVQLTIKGVVHTSLLDEEDENTETFALPAVWQTTGKKSTTPLAHRSARRVQDTFRAAGWDIFVWYGEYTKEYWVMDHNGLYSFDTLKALYLGMGWEDM